LLCCCDVGGGVNVDGVVFSLFPQEYTSPPFLSVCVCGCGCVCVGVWSSAVVTLMLRCGCVVSMVTAVVSGVGEWRWGFIPLRLADGMPSLVQSVSQSCIQPVCVVRLEWVGGWWVGSWMGCLPARVPFTDGPLGARRCAQCVLDVGCRSGKEEIRRRV
jgi:hypothetical protein